MFALGILSIIQLTLLPGLVVLLALRQTGGGLLRTLLLAFPISLLINHILAVSLVFAGQFTQTNWLVLFGIECALLLWLGRRQIARAPLAIWADDIDRIAHLGQTVRDDLAHARVSSLIVVTAAVACLAYVGVKAWNEIGEVFNAWDAVVSWNRWANDWSRNRLPWLTWGYPQLLPTTIATTYVFIGSSDVQFFAKGLMGVFPLAILLAQFELGLRRRELGYLSAVVITTVLLDQLLPEFLMSGYADVPTAALAFLGAYALMLVDDAPTRRDASVVTLIAAACAASAMLTKQAGIQFAAVFGVLAFLALRRRTSIGQAIVGAIVAVGLMLLVALPWYVMKIVEVRPDNERSELALIVGAHQGRLYWQRVEFGWLKIRDLLMPLPGGVVASSLVALSFCARSWLPCTLLLTVPGLVLWALFYSYDVRNLTIVLPFLGTAAGVGLHAACGRLAAHGIRFGAWPPPVRWMAIVILLIGATLYATWWMDQHTLYAHQVQKQRRIGYPELNAVIDQYREESKAEGALLSNYQLIGYLPGWREVYRFEPFDNLANLRQHLAAHKPGMLLVPETPYMPNAEVAKFIDAEVAAGTYDVVRRWQGWRLIKIHKQLAP